MEPVPAPGAASARHPSERAAPPTPPVGEVAETSATVVVSVVGLVARPGLVTLPTGSRVADAVDAAGGLLPDADPASVNLAAVVSDGQQVAVGVPARPRRGRDGAVSGRRGGRLNLNTATVGELDGPARHRPGPRAADRRPPHAGPFTSTDQLDDVPGIGPSIAASWPSW